jgi:Uma2 family endonuclease
MTEEEFVRWIGEKTRAEWADGEVIMMAPVSGEHSDFGLWLAGVLSIYVEEHDLGVVRGPEYMVRFPRQRQRRLPDVLFVAKQRAAILLPTHAEGAPDLIMEIVSPDSTARDWREKYLIYEKAGVGEYWIIDPTTRRVEAYSAKKGRKYAPIEEAAGRLNSLVIPGFFIRPEWLFGRGLVKKSVALKELGVLRA